MSLEDVTVREETCYLYFTPGELRLRRLSAVLMHSATKRQDWISTQLMWLQSCPNSACTAQHAAPHRSCKLKCGLLTPLPHLEMHQTSTWDEVYIIIILLISTISSKPESIRKGQARQMYSQMFTYEGCQLCQREDN